MPVEPERIKKLNDAPERPDRHYILYWAQMNRRAEFNHGLLYACELANRYRVPVLFYEGLTCTYEYANDRLHTFILQGVPETRRRLQRRGIGYVFYLRKRRSDRNDIFYELAQRAAAIVTDDYPAFIARQHNASVPHKLDTAYYVVDSSCIVPMSCIPARQYAAYTIRPKINRLLLKYLNPPDKLHVEQRFSDVLPGFHTDIHEADIPRLVSQCEIDHSVPASVDFAGGSAEAEKRLKFFLEKNLPRFAEARNEPSAHATSHMSPYLHFGQISSLEIALAVQEQARDHQIDAGAYLEELIVRRELSFNYSRHVDEPGDLKNLPDWCQETMKKHAQDERSPIYSARQIELTETYDELWNATQQEMLHVGKIHGYYRMYWGKKIIEWSETYERAAKLMIDLHGRYALDGRDPNTFTNILWCFGLHDRPWPERSIFGKMRFLSLDGMKRKTDTRAYIEQIRRLPALPKRL